MSPQRHDHDDLNDLARDCGYDVCDERTQPGREARLSPIPAGLSDPLVAHLERRHPGGLYLHQALAIEACLAGEDVCLATPTASGKSLAFMAAAAELVSRDPAARVLALYPAKALIQDQRGKWDGILDPLGLRAGFVDGGVPVGERNSVFARSQVLLMTPDVVHAWLLREQAQAVLRSFLDHLALVVLDEAHVYEGVFGSNMAFLIRRLEVAAPRFRLFGSSATVGAPEAFLGRLTGRTVRVLDGDQDGAGAPEKRFLLLRPDGRKPFEAAAALVRALADRPSGRFLVFGNSRRLVERLVSATGRGMRCGEAIADECVDDPLGQLPRNARVLPFRAGYEKEDARAIQAALGDGRLRGVVSTSALELGLDIGDIDTVVLLGMPPTMKAFLQRAGRAGRRVPGACLVVDERGQIDGEGLDGLFARPVEENRLYLDNRYLQYIAALCAAPECGLVPGAGLESPPFLSLPEGFRALLSNELLPTTPVPDELYHLKQRAGDDPHHEFPLRSGVMEQLTIHNGQVRSLGTVDKSQAMREAFPGAVYYYLGQPYRVYEWRPRKREIFARHEGHLTTDPLLQTAVFPRFAGGLFALWVEGEAFLAEVELQVSERLVGFVEKVGKTKQEHLYGPGSPYAQQPLVNFFPTTGVCLRLPDGQGLTSDAVQRLREAFCQLVGVHEHDVGIGNFCSNRGPLGPDGCRGLCFFDAAYGGLRLTRELATRLPEVLLLAQRQAQVDGNPAVVAELEGLVDLLAGLVPAAIPGSGAIEDLPAASGDFVVVIAGGERAIYRNGSGPEEVVVLGHRYTPQGLMYDLETAVPGARRAVAARWVHPLHGETRLLRVNLMTGEVQPWSEGE